CYQHFLLFFFFQAEDGIRDFHVTGVQTCALPISEAAVSASISTPVWPLTLQVARMCTLELSGSALSSTLTLLSISGWQSGIRSRSEERRVGKECRSRWWTTQ